MKKLDVYIAMLAAKNFFTGVVAFFGLYVFIDLFDRVHKLANPDGSIAWGRLFSYYLCMAPGLFQQVCSIIFCLSCVFVLARMHKKSQLVAATAGGISLNRLVSVFFMSALVLGFFLHLSQEFINPYAKRILYKLKLEKEVASKGMETASRIQFKDNVTFHLLSKRRISFLRKVDIVDIGGIDFKTGEIKDLHVTLFDDQLRPRAKIFASRALWKDQNTILLSNGFSKPYGTEEDFFPNDIKSWNFFKEELKVNIPLVAAFYAKRDPDALSFMELSCFSQNQDMFSKLVYRIIEPFYPFFSIIIVLALSLPVLFFNPIFAYFSALIASMGFYGIASSLKVQFTAQNMSLDMLVFVLISIALFSYILGRKITPT